MTERRKEPTKKRATKRAAAKEEADVPSTALVPLADVPAPVGVTEATDRQPAGEELEALRERLQKKFH